MDGGGAISRPRCRGPWLHMDPQSAGVPLPQDYSAGAALYAEAPLHRHSTTIACSKVGSASAESASPTNALPPRWLWNVTVHLTGGLPMGSAKDLDTAKAEFKAAWEALKARTTPEQLAAAYKDMNIRDAD